MHAHNIHDSNDDPFRGLYLLKWMGNVRTTQVISEPCCQADKSAAQSTEDRRDTVHLAVVVNRGSKPI